MTSRRQRKLAKQRQKSQQDATDRAVDGLYRPKVGPGQVFQRELVGMETGHAKRLRNIAASPLSLAYHRGQLCVPPGCRSTVTAEDRRATGEWFERLWATVHSSGMRDSTDLGINGSDRLFWTEPRQNASNEIARIEKALPVKDFTIIRCFCGEGYSMIESIRRAGIPVAPGSTALRVCEAIDELVYMTGRASRPKQHTNSPTAIASNGIATHPFQEGA
jgi:hypothetical protein